MIGLVKPASMPEVETDTNVNGDERYFGSVTELGTVVCAAGSERLLAGVIQSIIEPSIA